jgi:dTDP-4-amino-4,6-dideoxygalactose transaminase
MSALLLDIQPGDEVILPAFTFVSTANAFVLRGARPVFIDIRPDTLNLDERLLESKVSSRTRVVVPVHYAGVGCEMDDILPFAQAKGLAVVEDNAHGLFGRYRGRPLGSFGTFATLSFHETKNVTCGEGGALLINDAVYMRRAETIREKGTNRSQFFRGEIDKYGWVDLGSSYLPAELLAAFLQAQLAAAETIQARRRNAWEWYERNLGSWARANGVRLPLIPAHCTQAFHMFYLLLPSFEQRQAFIRHMAGRGVTTPFHYVPLNTSVMGQRLGGRNGDCPVAEDVSGRLVRLPLFASITQDEQSYVVEQVLDFRG